MKKRVFVLIATASLAVAACSGNNQDAVDNAQLNQANEDLNAMSSDAANDAANAEAEALGTQQQQLEQANAAADNTSDPTDAEEQNVSGM